MSDRSRQNPSFSNVPYEKGVPPLQGTYEEQARAENAAREAELSSPEAEQYRAASASAYANYSPEQASDLFLQTFGYELEQATPDISKPLREAEKVVSYRGETAAVIDPPGPDSRALLTSTVPLRTEQGEIPDLSLDREGAAIEPKKPLVPVTMPVELADGVRFEESGITIRLLGAAPSDPDAKLRSSSGGQTDEQLSVYPEALTDTDIALSAKAAGIQAFAQLRSRQSPEELALEFELPEGATLEADRLGLATVRDDSKKPILAIEPPLAVDAQGRDVAVKATAAGDRLTWTIDHAEQDLAYPILVDPAFEYWNWYWGYPSGLGPPTWNYYSNGWSNYGGGYDCSVAPACDGSGLGLTIFAYPGAWYPGNSAVQWIYNVPGSTSYIDAAFIYYLRYYRGGDSGPANPYGYFGLLMSGAWYELDYFYYSGVGGWDTGPGCCSVKSLVLGMGAGYSQTAPDWRYIRIAELGLYLDDLEKPTVSLDDPGEAPTEWISGEPQLQMTASASDPGLGVHHYAVYTEDKHDASGFLRTPTWIGCGGSYSNGLCPANDEGRVVTYPTAGLPDGRNKVSMSAVDAVDWETPEASDAEWDVRIDRSGPTLELSGSLAETPGYQLTGQSYDLHVTAREGSLDDRALERSGVEDIKLFLDGGATPVAQETWPDCPESSCRQELDYTLDAGALSPGKHTLEIRSTDQVGNETIRKLSLTRDGQAGVITSPKAGDTTSRRFNLRARANHEDLTGVTFEYKAPGATEWQDVPLEHLRMLDDSTPTAYPLALDEDGEVTTTWDLPPSPGMVDGKVRIRARFAGPGAPSAPAAGDPGLHWRLGEPEGTVAADSSGNEHRGTYLNSPTLDVDGAPAADTDHDGAVELDGVDDGVASTDYEPFVNGEAQTFAGWANRDTANDWATLISGGLNSDGTTPYLMLNYGADANDVQFRPGGSNYVQRTWADAWPGTGEWVHWALVFDEPANTVELFIDGQSKGLKSFGGKYPATPGTFRAGVWADYGGNYYQWDGKLDELMVYDRALTATEIQGLSGNISAGLSQVVPVTLERDDTTSKHASAPIGPGNLDLLTGNFTLTEDDVSIDSFGSDLTVSRTHASREPGKYPDGPFGPGWVSSVPVDAAGSDYSQLTEAGPSEHPTSVIRITTSDSTDVLFNKDGNAYKVEALYAGLELTPTGNGYVLRDLDGNTTTFVKPSGASEYLPVKVHQPGSGGETTTRFFYETVDGVTRVYAALAPVASGVSCTNSAGEMYDNGAFVGHDPGCRSIWFYYADSTTATGTGPAGWGDYAGRLREITFYAHDGSEWVEPSVARYDYDSQGRLRAAWDPRISPALKTTYKYESDGRLKEVKPPGENAWTLTYKAPMGADENNPGRLASTSRAVPGGGTATTTVEYDVPLSGSGSPYDMTPGRVDDWGQTDVPTDATAIDPPTSMPATVHYMNRNGDLVNLAAPGGEISTTEYDSHRMVRRELSPGNRARALASSDPASTAQLLDTQLTYSSDGVELVEELEPQHEMQLADGQLVEAREHTVNAYDEGAPGNQDYHLPTTKRVGARIAGQGNDVQVRVTKTEYDWTLRQPTAVIIDPGGLNLVSRTTYDSATGLPTETRRPKGAGGDGMDAHTTKTTYWSATGSGECQGAPGLVNLPCMEAVGGQPTTGAAPELPTTYYDEYNIWNQVTSLRQQVAGASDRVTTTTYDDAARVTQMGTSGGVGTPVPTVSRSYSATSGDVVAITAGGRTISRGYDALGRPTSYTDADGATSTTSYDELDRPVTTFDGKGTTTTAYDSTTGRATATTDSGVGVFAASYDADGNVVAETLPNQTQTTASYNSVGEATSRAYTRAVGTSQLPLMGFTVSRNAHGQVVSEAQTAEGVLSSSATYDYDAAGRLAKTWDIRGGAGCVGRDYSYDANSNRVGLRTIAPGAGGACDTSQGAGDLVSHSYDEADRTIDAGYAYDRYGRTLSGPASDAGGAQLQATYFADNRVRSLTQGSTTRTFSIDPAGRVRMRATTGEPDEIYHYSDDSDSPAWVEMQNGAGDWERYVGSLSGTLTAVERGHGSGTDGVTYQLTNLHGDVVGEADSQGDLTATFDSDEFGVPQGPTPATGYGWLGGKERRTQFASGVVTMGQRVYLPQVGRFLQTDPVEGGSFNDYDYAYQDPLNQLDLDGQCPWCAVVIAVASVGARAALRGAARGGSRVARRAAVRARTGIRIARGLLRAGASAVRVLGALKRISGRAMYRFAHTKIGSRLFGSRGSLNTGKGRMVLGYHVRIGIGKYDNHKWFRIGIGDKKNKPPWPIPPKFNWYKGERIQ